MKKLSQTIAALVMLVFFPMLMHGQSIQLIEYFFDNDPGVGSGWPIVITPTDTILDDYILTTVGLTQGHHIAYIRIQNTTGAWSIYEGRPFYIPDSAIVTQPQTYRVEYYVDNDPGVGNGIQLLYNPSDTLDVNFTIPTTGMSTGPHFLYTRVYDTQNTPSFTRVDTFTICSSSISGLSLSDLTACVGDTVDLVLSGNNLTAASQFLWDVDSDGTYEGVTTVPQWQWIPDSMTQTTITVVAVEASGCETSTNAAVSIDPYFSGLSFDLIPPSSSVICPGDSASVQWLSSYTGNLFEVKYYLNGVYDSTFTILHANGEGDTVHIQAAFILNEPCRDVDTIWSSVLTFYRISLPDPFVMVSAQLPQYCANQLVDLLITPMDPGTGVQYLIFKNNLLVATITPNDNLPYVYTLTGVVSGDSISVAMIHFTPCIGIDTVYSNYTFPNIISAVAPSVGIQALVGSFCQGDTVLAWISSTQLSGTNPSYQWYRNGVALSGENGDTLFYLNTGAQDTLYLSMTSNDPCASTQTVLSNTIIQTGQTLQTPSVSIVQVTANPCVGDSVAFQVNAYAYGGLSPGFEWWIDGVMSGLTGPSITLSVSQSVAIQVRMTSTLVCVSSTAVLSNVIQTSVNPILVPSFQIMQMDTVCSGAVSTFYINNLINAPASYTVEWYLDGALQNGVLGDTVGLPITLLSTVHARLISNSPCVANSIMTAITPYAVVDPVAIASVNYAASGDSACFYNPIELAFSHTNLPTVGPIIIWYGNGSIVDTTYFPLPPTSTVFVNNFADSMHVYGVVEWQNSCGITNSISTNALLIYRRGKVNTSFSIGGQNSTVVNQYTFCQNEGMLLFSMSHVPDSIYSPSAIQSAIDYTNGTIDISAIPPGNYVVNYLLTDPINLCAMYDSLNITVLAAPQQPIIVQSGALLQISNPDALSTYQWLDASLNPILGETTTSFSPSSDGSYYVQSSYSNGCSAQSTSFDFQWFSISHDFSLEASVFPVPFSERLNIRLEYTGLVNYTISDALGRQVKLDETISQGGFEILDLEDLPPGIYFLTIHAEQQQKIFRIMK